MGVYVVKPELRACAEARCDIEHILRVTFWVLAGSRVDAPRSRTSALASIEQRQATKPWVAAPQ